VSPNRVNVDKRPRRSAASRAAASEASADLAAAFFIGSCGAGALGTLGELLHMSSGLLFGASAAPLAAYLRPRHFCIKSAGKKLYAHFGFFRLFRSVLVCLKNIFCRPSFCLQKHPKSGTLKPETLKPETLKP
jgi:hypothetical protein